VTGGHRQRAAAFLVACAVLVSGCGTEDTTAPSNPSDLATVKALTPDQAAAIEKVYVEALRLEAKGGVAKRRTRAASDAAIAPVLRACGALDGNDALMRELFRSCAGEGTFLRFTAGTYRCTNPDLCSEAYMAQRAALGRLVAAERRADRAVRATALAPACKQVLTTPASSYAGFRELDGLLVKIINALESQSRRDRTRAARAARAFEAPVQSTQGRLDLFRSSCR